jgi:hypothetical protein
MVTLTVRLNDSFTRLNDLKRTSTIKYPNKKKDSNVIDWQHSATFKKEKKKSEKG